MWCGLIRWTRLAAAALACTAAAGCSAGARDLDRSAGERDGGRPRVPSGPVHEDGGWAVRDAGAGAADAAPSDDSGRPQAPPPTSQPPIDVSFAEVGREAGLDSMQAPLATEVGCHELPEGKCWFSSVHMSGGAAAGDYDGDGLVDLYVTRLIEPGILYRNRGDGRFDDATEAAGLSGDEGGNGAAFGDVDGDGDLDLYVTNVLRKRYALYVNEGGHFDEQGAQRGADAASDARHHGFSPAFGDYDGDGFLDLHLTEWVQLALDEPAPSHARLLHNRGRAAPGYFEDTTELAGVDLLGGPRGTRTSYSSRFADMDADGALDLLVVADFGASRLFWNERDGFLDGTLFSGVGGDQNGMGSALGDYDGDGDLDWFITSIFDPDYRCDNVTCGWGITGNRLYRNEGARHFADATDEAGVRDGGWGWGAEFLDFDNDGALDLVMTNGVDFPNPEAELFRRDPTRLWRNVGGGRFEDAALRVGLDDHGDGKGLLVFDYDRDGDQDLLIAQHEGRALLYRNDGGEQNAWLTVELQGRASNRHGLGAHVFVTRAAGERALLREVSGGNAFLGQSEAVAHFGLGAWTGPLYELRVRWPSGREQVLREVEPRQRLEVREPL